MNQLTPGETYPLHKVLADPLGTETRYVQATVRNGTDNTTIATLNLSDLGNRRFRVIWDVPNVKYVVIDFKVYTDSGYTNLDPNEAIESRDYIVETRWSQALGSGAGGYSMRPSEVREVLREELDKTKHWEMLHREIAECMGVMSQLKMMIGQIEMPKLSTKRLENGLKELEAAITSLDQKDSLRAISEGLKSILEATQGVGAAVASLPEPFEPEPVNLSPVIEAINALDEKLPGMFEEVKKSQPRTASLSLNLGDQGPEAPSPRRVKNEDPRQRARNRSIGL